MSVDLMADQFWVLPDSERDSLWLDLQRRCIAAVPCLEWSAAASWVLFGIVRAEKDRLCIGKGVEAEISARKTAQWVEKQITALEIFGSHGRSGAYSGHVYFLRAGPFVKIGFTSGSPQSRIRELMTGCPYRQVLIGARSCTRATETWLHQMFSKQRANLEWFHATELLLLSIELLSEVEFLLEGIENQQWYEEAA